MGLIYRNVPTVLCVCVLESETDISCAVEVTHGDIWRYKGDTLCQEGR